MKVLHVVASSRRRGGELFAADLAAALLNCGVRQRVAVLDSREGQGIAYPVPTDALGVPGRMVPGLRVRLTTAFKLGQLITRSRPDVIQAHGGEPLKYAILAGRLGKVPVVYRRIGGAPRWLRRGPRRWAHAALMRRAARIVAVAEAVREETISLFGIPPQRVLTIPNGVDSRRLVPARGRLGTRDELEISAGAPVTISVGSLSWEKDPRTQLLVIQQVVSSVPELVHLMVGDGPLLPDLRQMIRDLRLEERVRLLGARQDIGDLLAAADLLLFTSRADGMEGMPAALIEAGMTGVPAVAYDVAGVREVVADGVTGLVVSERNVAALVGAVQRLIQEEELRRRLGSAGESFCRSRFDIRVIAPKYRDLYGSLMGSK